MRFAGVPVAVVLTLSVGACTQDPASTVAHATGYVEATDIRVAAKVPGRVETVSAVEGARVEAGTVLVTLSTADVDLALRRAHAERAQAAALLELTLAGPRPEDVRQAEAQLAAAQAERQAADADLAAARADEQRFEQLLRARAGSQKQFDDAAARRALAAARLQAAADRAAAAKAALDRLAAGARAEEIAAARARVGVMDAQIAALERDRTETAVVAPSAGLIASRLVEPGELVSAGTPLVLLLDLDRAWASVYVEEPVVPRLKLEQAVTVLTDAGDRLPGRISFIASRAEFTPRNVQTAAERAKLVYRVKVAVDNREGVLKPGMPVEVDLGLPAR